MIGTRGVSFFFSSRRRHTRSFGEEFRRVLFRSEIREVEDRLLTVHLPADRNANAEIGRASCREKSVDLGGRRIIKKKKKETSMMIISDLNLSLQQSIQTARSST